MKKQVYNPYLPLYEYIPDGEPHIYEGRVYVYGSHDCYGAFPFSHNNYVSWSAPIDDLSDWRYEGLLFDKREDPSNRRGKKDLFAPDVTRGPDGKYYLYYSLYWSSRTGVGVSDHPSGPFKFLGEVKYPDGTVLGTKKGDVFHFDPGVFTDEDGEVYLYSGFGSIFHFPMIKPWLKIDGAYVMRLDKDMLTIKEGPIKIADKGNAKKNMNGAPKDHAFFEASSMRKIGDTYYFIYSTLAGHELAYMTSKSPMGPFEYQGVLISNGDVGYEGRSKKNASYPLGNNHGSLVCVKDQWYIFYHRHTNYTNTDRQACAEKIYLDENGRFAQVRRTSCGLNEGPLKGKGRYPASICCYMIPKGGNIFYPFCKNLIEKHTKTYLTQSGKDEDIAETQYIKNIKDGCVLGYRYFDLRETNKLLLSLEGKGRGEIEIFYEENGPKVASSSFEINSKDRKEIEILIPNGKEEAELYLKFKMKGKVDLYDLIFE